MKDIELSDQSHQERLRLNDAAKRQVSASRRDRII